jgi:hypothetical protein
MMLDCHIHLCEVVVLLELSSTKRAMYNNISVLLLFLHSHYFSNRKMGDVRGFIPIGFYTCVQGGVCVLEGHFRGLRSMGSKFGLSGHFGLSLGSDAFMISDCRFRQSS